MSNLHDYCGTFKYKTVWTKSDAWTKSGITDLKHLSERIAKHEASYVHITNKLQLDALEIVNAFSF